MAQLGPDTGPVHWWDQILRYRNWEIGVKMYNLIPNKLFLRACTLFHITKGFNSVRFPTEELDILKFDPVVQILYKPFGARSDSSLVPGNRIHGVFRRCRQPNPGSASSSVSSCPTGHPGFQWINQCIIVKLHGLELGFGLWVALADMWENITCPTEKNWQPVKTL